MINPLMAAYFKRKKDAEFKMPDDPDAFIADLSRRVDEQNAAGYEGDGPQQSDIADPPQTSPSRAVGGPPKITVSRGPVEPSSDESPSDQVRAYLLKRMNQRPEAHGDSDALRGARAADSLFGAGAEISNLYLQLRGLHGIRKGTNLAGDVAASEATQRAEKLKDQSGRDAMAQRVYSEQMDADAKAAERESIDAKAAADRAERMGRETRMGDQFKMSLDERQREAASKAERDAAELALKEKALNKPRQFAPKAAPKTAGLDEGKMLPATTVEGLAELPVAEAQVDHLASEFKRLKMGGASGRAGSTVTNALGLGFTDSAEYNAAKRIANQAAGKILEGGKLAAGDEVKYDAMMPRGGDSDEVVADKVAALKDFLRSLARARAQGLKESGYKVSERFLNAGKAPGGAPSGVVHMRNDAGLEIDVPPEKVEARKKAGFKEIGP